MRIAIIGERFNDVYYHGSASVLSPEAPIPCVKVSTSTVVPGGAGNVARNVRALGAETIEFYQPGNIPTKSRLLVGDVQLARWDERDYCLEAHPLVETEHSFHSADAIIISDYGKGMFTLPLVKWLSQFIGTPTFVDTKRNPELYSALHPTYFPNRKEFTEHLSAYGVAERVVYKQGEYGLSYLRRGHTVHECPAKSQHPRNVSGAGDTVIAAFTVAQMRGLSIKDSLDYAALAATVTCNSLITASATDAQIAELKRTLH